MAKGKAAAADTDVETAEVGAIEAAVAALNIDLSFATGDARDAMLNVIRATVDWGKFDEQRQRDINAAVQNAAQGIVAQLVLALASDDRPSVAGKLEQITVKDGLKLQLTAVHTHDNLVLLGDLTGKHVLICNADATKHDKARGPARVDLDQADLLPGVAGDQDLVDAADAPVKTGDTMDIEGQGLCELRVSITTGMIEGKPPGADDFSVDVREATSTELAAERERTAMFNDGNDTGGGEPNADAEREAEPA